MKFDLAQMARDRGDRRKSVRLKRIHPTNAIENDLLAIYADGQKIWSDLARKIISIWVRPELVTDASGAEISWLVDQAQRASDNTMIYQTERLGRWVTRTGTWHGARTIAGVKSALGVEIAPFIRLGDVRDLLDETIRANVALISSVNADNRTRIEQVVYDGFVNRRTKKFIIDEMAKAMGITKRRARIIANDQSFKLGIALTAYRNIQMGITKYGWRHNPNMHPRKHHIARDGRVFEWARPPYDGHPGYAISCHCDAEPIVEIY